MIRLRTQIFLLLFVLGLLPMIAVTVLNLPLVLNQLHIFVQHTHMQNMRLEFLDLEQHMTSRQEIVAFLAKLSLPKNSGDVDSEKWFSRWINQLLTRALDVVEVIYIDAQGNEYLHLKRETMGGELMLTQQSQNHASQAYFQSTMQLLAEEVVIGSIIFQQQQPLMRLYMMSPLKAYSKQAEGIVMVKLDLTGLPNAHPNSLWVLNNGQYLHQVLSEKQGTTASAFIDFPGLEQVFAQRQLASWSGDEAQILWVPLFSTNQGPLWVGRFVDPSEIETFAQTLLIRVFIIVIILIITILLLSHFLAGRAEQFGHCLLEGIRGVLDHQREVVFTWKGSKEIQDLANDLNRLTQSHAKMTQDLYQRAQELEESNRYKSQFLANVSHELRTPLNSILALSKLLQAETELNRKQKKQAEIIYNAGNDLLCLINDILDLAKIEAKKVHLKISTIYLVDFIQNIIDLLRPLANDKGLVFKLDIDADCPAVIISDQEKIGQILKNFLSNAIKFTEFGDIRLVLTRNQTQDNTQRPLMIKVIDTGIGIPSDKLAQVFEAFRQVDGSTSRKYGGTGLGLTISWQIAELLGGRIDVESELGKGSTFCLYLPLAFDINTVDQNLIDCTQEQLEYNQSSVELVKAKDDNNTTVELSSNTKLQPMRVLILDDDINHLLVLTPLLEQWGLMVMAAENQEEMLETFTTEQGFDILLFHITMPMDQALEDLAVIKKHSKNKLLYLVVLVESQFSEWQQQQDIDMVLSWPIDAELLLQSLKQLQQKLQ